MRNPSTTTRQYPGSTAARESLHPAMKTQGSPKQINKKVKIKIENLKKKKEIWLTSLVTRGKQNYPVAKNLSLKISTVVKWHNYS